MAGEHICSIISTLLVHLLDLRSNIYTGVTCPPPLTVSIKRNVVSVHISRSILGLVLGEKEEIFAQRAGEFGHFLAAVMGGAGGITLPLLYTTVHLKTKDQR